MFRETESTFRFDREQLAKLYEEAPCGFLVTTLDGKICQANRTFAGWIDRSGTELVGANIRDLLSPASNLFYDTHFAAVLYAGRAVGMSMEICRSHADPLPVLVTSTIVNAHEGTSAFIHSTLFDASERRNSERALVVAKRRADALADIVRSSPHPILSLDYDLHLQTWNAAAADLLKDEVTFEAGFCVLPTLAPSTHTSLIECMETGKPVARQTALQNGTICKMSAFPMTEGIAIYLEDITSEAKTQNELREAHDRFTLVTMATTDGIWDWNCETGVVYLSGRAQSMCGYGTEAIELPLKTVLRRLHPKDLADLRAGARVDAGARFAREWRIRHGDGTWLWVQSRGMSLEGDGGRRSRMIGSLTDVTGRKTEDPLTGLHTRLSLLNRLEWRLQADDRFPRPCALLFSDIDAFKRVNDGLGHAAGDALISEIATRLRQCLGERTGALAARLGGDEFVVLLEEVNDEEDACSFAQCFLDELQAPIVIQGQQVSITASIGVALSRPFVGTAEDLLHNADLAMYRAKALGKGRVVVFSAEMHRAAHHKLTLEADLHQAVQDDMLELFYQPKIDLVSGAVVGYEALGRWKHPVHGMVSPDLFIAIAEDSNLIREIGRWTMRKSIGQLAEWRNRGLVSESTTMSINLSPKQFDDSELLQVIRQNLQNFDMPASCVHFEVTEGVLISDVDTALSVLQGLKAIGVGLELDDFGKGYSSLGYLHRYPFDSLKIDKSFVANLGSQEDSSAIVRTVISLAHALGLKVIAEGVETAKQERHLKQMGCEYGQGYLFSKPLPPHRLFPSI